MFFAGVGPVEVQWYFTPKGAKPLGVPTCYNSLNWWSEGDRPAGTPGEVQGATRRWVNGRDPGHTCTTPKGDADAWRGLPGPLFQCETQPMSQGGIEIGGHAIYHIADTFTTGGGGGEGNGQGGFLQGFEGSGGGEGNGGGTWFHAWIGSGGGSGNGEGTFASVVLSEGGGSGNGEGDFGTPGDDMPIGAICWWPATTPPADWLYCDGSAVSRTTYAALFTIFGTTYGAGDGSTTFNLPNLQGRGPIGRGTDPQGFLRTLGVGGGAAAVALTTPNLPAHTHAQDANTMVFTGAAFFQGGVGPVPSYQLGGTTQSTGSGTSHANMQPYLVLTPIIKYQ